MDLSARLFESIDRLLPMYRELGRVASVEDVSAAVVYLASPAADFITGTVLPIDGGLTSRKSAGHGLPGPGVTGFISKETSGGSRWRTTPCIWPRATAS